MNYAARILLICFLLYAGSLLAQQGGSYEMSPFNKELTLPQNKFVSLTAADTQGVIDQINYSITLDNSRHDTAVAILNDALAKSWYLKFDCGIAAAFCNLAVRSNSMGDYAKSEKYYRDGLPYALKAFPHRTMMAMYYTSMGTPYYYTGQYDSMSYFAYKAEQVIAGKHYKNLASAKDVAAVYSNIGMLWKRLSDYDKALEYIGKARDVLAPYRDSINAAPMLATVYGNTGLVYADMKMTAQAKAYFDTVLQRYNGNDAVSLLGIAKLLARDSAAKAVALLRQTINITEQTADYQNEVDATCTLGIIYYQLKEYSKAERLLTSVVKNSGKSELLDLYNNYFAYNTLAATRKEAHDYKQAYAYSEISKQLLDSIMTRERFQSVYEQEFKLRTTQKDKEITEKQLLLARRESQLRKKNLWMGTIGAGALLLAFSLISVYRNSRNRQRLQAEKIYSIQQEQEIGNLKAMIKGEEKERARLAGELHDGIMVQLSTVKMNIMNMAEADSTMHIYEPVIQQVDDAAKELRRTAHNLMPDMLLQGGLSEAVFYFCNTLQKNTNLVISFQQHGEIPRVQTDFELSVYRIIQELLQNVIKHAAASKVIVQLAHVDDRTLAITIEDDGLGFDTIKAFDSKGMGLKSIRSRVQVLNGNMDIRSKPGEGTTVHLEFEMPGGIIS